MRRVRFGVYPAVTMTTYQTSQYIQRELDNIADFHSYQKLIKSEEFGKLLKDDLKSILKRNSDRKSWEKANNFFEEHGQFIDPYFATKNPGKASELWLELLEIVTKADSKKYDSIHKGTAYYFAGIWSLFAEKYTEGLQWLEYAYEEDLRLNEPRRPPEEYPAAWLLTLDLRENKSEKGNDFEKTRELVKLLDEIFNEINSEFKKSFRRMNLAKIAREKVLTSRKRALRSSWASLLASIWDFKRLQRFLAISPQKTEAQFEVNNFLVNLTLVLETFIPRHNLPEESDGTLAELYRYEIKEMYGFSYKNRNKVFLCQDFPNTYQGIGSKLKRIERQENKLKVAFTLSFRIRNQTHHMFNEEFISLSLFKMVTIRVYYSIFSVLFHDSWQA